MTLPKIQEVQSRSGTNNQWIVSASLPVLDQKANNIARGCFEKGCSSPLRAFRSLKNWIWNKLGSVWNKVSACWKKREPVKQTTSTPVPLLFPSSLPQPKPEIDQTIPCDPVPPTPPNPPPGPLYIENRVQKKTLAKPFLLSEAHKQQTHLHLLLNSLSSSVSALGEFFESYERYEKNPSITHQQPSYVRLKHIRSAYEDWDRFLHAFEQYKKQDASIDDIEPLEGVSQEIWSKFHEHLLQRSAAIHQEIFALYQHIDQILMPFRGEDSRLKALPTQLAENVCQELEDYYDFYTLLEKTCVKYEGPQMAELLSLRCECMEILTSVELLREKQVHADFPLQNSGKILQAALLSLTMNPVSETISMVPQRLRGIPNPDMTCCYMNSFLQIILNCTPLRKAFEVPVPEEEKGSLSDHKSKERIRMLLKRFTAAYDNDYNLYTHLTALRKSVFESGLHYDLDMEMVRQLGRYQQQDAAAFALCVLEVLRFEPVVESILIKETGQGICETRNSVVDPTVKVHFAPGESILSVQEHLESSYFGEEVLEGVKDSETGAVVPAKRKLRWRDYPEAFILQVVRNEFDKTTGQSFKIKSPVNIDGGVLDMRMACESTEEPKNYVLTGFLEHVNKSQDERVKETLAGGHYRSFVNRGGEWFLLNDGADPQKKTEEEMNVHVANMYLGVFERV